MTRKAAFQVSAARWLLLVLCGCSTAAAAAADASAPATRPATQPADYAAERLAVAMQALSVAQQMYERGIVGFEAIAECSARVADESRDPSFPQEQRIKQLTHFVETARQLEAIAQRRHQAGMSTQLEALSAKYTRLRAEQWLRDAQAK